MLNLKLRQEFLGKRLKGTLIELVNDEKTGATQMAAKDFLEITYPTLDLLKGLEAVGPQQGRPVVIIGERGLGKSHLLATLFHAVNDAVATRTWLLGWMERLEEPSLGELPQRSGMLVIGESLHRQRYKFLWDILLDGHPYGQFIRGKWEGMGAGKTDVPSDKLMLELLRNQPTMLVLDEFQTWYDGLTNNKQNPYRHWAFNFIQILSEIAKEHPELLVLVVSVRDGETEAYQQIHRVNPVQIDFKAGGSSERMLRDRRRMLLHRLFENRQQIAPTNVKKLIATHVAEYFRLMDIPAADQERRYGEFLETWPFAPHLLRLLEDQVLIATSAQETRDLIRILVNLFKAHGDKQVILTAGDFRLDEEGGEIGALLDSVANQRHRTLRDKALRNIASVVDVLGEEIRKVKHLQEIMGALWLRSIAVDNLAGADPTTLQVDITRDRALDENVFRVELDTIVENSFNIHREGVRLMFREADNPQAKLIAFAKNDKLFTDDRDLVYLAKEIRYVVSGGEEIFKSSRVIVLPKLWRFDPWRYMEESEHPDRWDERIALLVLPEVPERMGEYMGQWLKERLQKRRNTVRFLLPKSGLPNNFRDRDLLLPARATMLAQEWGREVSDYKPLHTKYQKELRDILKKRFDRFAVLTIWNYVDSRQCVFNLEAVRPPGVLVPEAVENVIRNDLFVPEDFEEYAMQAAENHSSLGKLMRDLQEPRPGGRECIPWLGETFVKERLLRLCSKGKVAISLHGMELLQSEPGEDEERAWQRLKGKLSDSGRLLDGITLLPAMVAPVVAGTMVGTEEEGGQSGDKSGGMGLVNKKNIFNPEPPKPMITLTTSATSPVNLLGRLETWGIGPAFRVANVTLKLNAATGAQLIDILKKLPDGMTFALTLDKEGEG